MLSAVPVGLSKFCISILLVTVFCLLGKCLDGHQLLWVQFHFGFLFILGFFGVNWPLSSSCNNSSIFHHLSVFFQATEQAGSKGKQESALGVYLNIDVNPWVQLVEQIFYTVTWQKCGKKDQEAYINLLCRILSQKPLASNFIVL